MDPRATNNILRWAVENSDASRSGDAPAQPRTKLDSGAIDALFGGGKDLKDMMNIIEATDGHENAIMKERIETFEDLEEHVSQIDNAMGFASTDLWTRLVDLLDHPEPEIRLWAAWCCGTAVENTPRVQERVS
jgi:hsp70-interacting protein